MQFETEFEWDVNKEERNYKKHGITFEDAATVFWDYLSITISDLEHSTTEDRYITVGKSIKGQTLVVVHCDRKEKIRIISARKADPDERRKYEEGK
jgi:hypothetical protein